MASDDDSTLRDSWGFAVGNVELYAQYSPIWETEEEQRIQLWESFLAEEVNDCFNADPTSVGRNDLHPSLENLAQRSLQDAVSIAHSAGDSAPERHRFDSLVSGGVPFQIRGKVRICTAHRVASSDALMECLWFACAVRGGANPSSNCYRHTLRKQRC